MNLMNTASFHQKCLGKRTIHQFVNGLIRFPGFVYIDDHARSCHKCSQVFSGLYRKVVTRKRNLIHNLNFAFATKIRPGCLSPRRIEAALQSDDFGQIVISYLNYHSSFCIRCNALLSLLLCYREIIPDKDDKADNHKEVLISLNALSDNAVLHLVGQDNFLQLKEEQGVSINSPFVDLMVVSNLKKRLYLSMEFQEDLQGQFEMSNCDIKEIKND